MLGVVLFFWVIGIVWVAKDSYARMDSSLKQFGSLVLVTIFGPIIGVALYIALRPARYRSMDTSYQESTSALCLSCGQHNDSHHSHCVFCGEKIHLKCRECQSAYPASYAYCPDCGAPNIDKN